MSDRKPEDFEFPSPEVATNPYPFYEAVRAHAPVYKVPGQAAYLLTSYDDVLHAAKCPHQFSSRRPLVGSGDPEIEEIRKRGYPQVGTLTNADPPSHDQYRKLVSRLFVPRRVTALEEPIAEIATRLFAEMSSRRDSQGSVDFMAEYAVLIPLHVLAHTLGVDRSMFPDFKRWSDDVAATLNPFISREDALRCAESFLEFQLYFADQIEKRRVEPGDDFVTMLLSAHYGGERPLDVPEMLDIIRTFLVGGSETTSSLIGNVMVTLLGHREHLAAATADPTLIPPLIEEVLRLECPVQWLPRTVTDGGAKVGERELPAGSRALLAWGAANRDPAYFSDPATFDPSRDGTTHLAFGHGTHYCLGAGLARSQTRIAFEVALAGIGEIELATETELEYEPFALVRRPVRLPVQYSLRSEG